ncbi:MAG: site-2 protease family protein [Synechococcales cyanobacterium RM1_1_8]|nr:site-2 protease family protein [Synechococcales cyanobacterium RM1_1_8]
MPYFWLAILGWITYLILKRSVPPLKGQQLWLLWLVMMSPSLLWIGWTMTNPSEPIPPLLVFGSFMVCSFLYLLMLRNWRGELPSEQGARSGEAAAGEGASNAAKAAAALQASRSDRPKPKPPLTNDEEALLRQCFAWNTFFINKVEYRLQAVVCQGQLRTEPEQAYQAIKENVEGKFGDRFLVLLQEDFQGKPFFALVPNPQASPKLRKLFTTHYRFGLAALLLLLTLFTTALIGTGLAGVPIESIADLSNSPEILLKGLPYALPLLLILGIHESGHFFAARHYRLKTTLPYFIPVPYFLGTFGAFIQIRSPMPNRKVLFDVGVAGPLAGLVVALPLMFWGIVHSEVVPVQPESSFLNFEALNPRISILMTLLGRLLLGSALTENSALQLHPVAIAGYLGLMVTALNLMPIGQLDGGHMVHAMFGQKGGAIIGQVTRVLVICLAFLQRDLWIWAFMLLLIPAMDEPALNDVSELDDRRDGLGLATLVILLLIILPVPPGLANWLL